MAKWNVTIEEIRTATIEVEADSAEQAEAMVNLMPLPEDWDNSSRSIREDLTECTEV